MGDVFSDPVLYKDPAQTHRYQLLIVGLIPPDINPIYVSTIEEKLGIVELPDKTQEPDGILEPGRFTMHIPYHHTLAGVGMVLWFKECQGNQSPIHKKEGVLMVRSAAGLERIMKLGGIFPVGHKEAALSMGSPGNMAVTEWTIAFDSVEAVPIP